MTKTMRLLGLSAVLLATTSAAHSKILVDQLDPYSGYYVGGSDWTAFTAALASQGDGYQTGSVANATDVAGADAILLVARTSFGATPTLSATEMANLTGFLATGRRVAIVGDGVSFLFGSWTDSAVAFASGGSATVNYFVSQTATAIPGSDLTDGVTSVLLQGAGTVNGGTALFDANWATLWGDNLLTALDVNAFTQFAGPDFRDNVADWLGASEATAAVPEPASWAMLTAGFAIAGAAMRRRKAAISFG